MEQAGEPRTWRDVICGNVRGVMCEYDSATGLVIAYRKCRYIHLYSFILCLCKI